MGLEIIWLARYEGFNLERLVKFMRTHALVLWGFTRGVCISVFYENLIDELRFSWKMDDPESDLLLGGLTPNNYGKLTFILSYEKVQQFNCSMG